MGSKTISHKWNRRIHRMLLLWLRQVGVNFDAHYMEATRLNKIDGYYLTALSVFAALTAAASLVNVAEFEADLAWLSLTLKLIAASAALLVIFFNNMRDRHKFAEHATRNRGSAEQYDDLSAYIQVATLSDEKPEPGMFLRTIMDRFRFIKQAGPDLPEGFASIASLPNLILMKDAQKRAEGKRKVNRDVDHISTFITEEDRHLFGGSSTPDEAEDDNFAHRHPVRSEMMTECAPRSFEETVAQLPVEMERFVEDTASSSFTTDNIDDDDSTSMDIINEMGLCEQVKDNLPIEKGYADEAVDESESSDESSEPEKPVSPLRGIRNTILSRFNLLEDIQSPRERLDSNMSRKMEMLKLQNNAY